jgi:hypothetical protein
MAYYIRAVREKKQLKIFAGLTETFQLCVFSPYALNELYLALTQYILAQNEKNLRSFFLS